MPPESEAFIGLVLRHLDGSLPASERAGLVELLRRSAHHRSTFITLARQDAVLTEVAEAAAPVAAGPRRIPPVRRSRRRAEATGGRKRIGFTTGGLVASALLVLATMAALVIRRPEVRPTPAPPVTDWATLATGAGVEILRDGRLAAATAPAPLRHGDRLRIGHQPASVRWPDGTHLRAAAGASLELWEDGGIRIDLAAGMIRASVPPQETGRALRVRSSLAEAEVLGTSLRVSVEPQSTALSVDHGRVRFRRLADDAALVVPRGRSATVDTEGGPYLDGFTPLPEAPIGINCNGPSLRIEGVPWLSHQRALDQGLVVEPKPTPTRTAHRPSPPVDPALEQMLNSAIYAERHCTLRLPIQPGHYRLSLWFMENFQDDYDRSMTITVGDEMIADGVGQSTPLTGQWRRIGPVTISVPDGELVIAIDGHHREPHLMGLLIEVAP